MVLFFGLVFFSLPLWKFFCQRPCLQRAYDNITRMNISTAKTEMLHLSISPDQFHCK